MLVREYQISDCKEITKLFYNTVHTVNAKDYTKEQLDVWATRQVDLEKWNQSLQEHCSIVAVDNEIIVGFGDIDKDGYLDCLFTPIIREKVLQLLFVINWSKLLKEILLPMPLLRQSLSLKKEVIRLLKNDDYFNNRCITHR